MRENFSDLSRVRGLARVPEHSIDFMAAMSGGSPFVLGDFLFFAGGGWLTGIGYPLRSGFYPSDFSGGSPIDTASAEQGALALEFERAFPLALEKAVTGGLMEADVSGRADCFAAAPLFSPAFAGYVVERDQFLILPVPHLISSELDREVRKAAGTLRVDESREFTPEHRRLWAEFLVRPGMRPNVREMYAKTASVLAKSPDGLVLLNAWGGDGRLAACLLLDFAPGDFCSYIIGAHSRRNYSPHATDLLFSVMLEKAAQAGKRYVHLGLGVNPGITRFKRKWGGIPDLPFCMASFQLPLRMKKPSMLDQLREAGQADIRESALTEREPEPDATRAAVSRFMRGMLNTPAGLTKQQIFETLPRQRKFAMLWELEKNGRKSWIGGTAHFFYYSFENSFEKLFGQVDNVLFEGPLDAESLEFFERSGQTRQPGDACLYAMLTAEELAALARMVRGPEGRLARLQGLESAIKADVEAYLKNTRPWYAFFSLWTAFLERNGWSRSVDLDAWNQAKSMGKAVIAMESREEQLASLESVPADRIIRFFQSCRDWPERMRRNLKSYLLGDLGGMAGTSTEFPTRIRSVIGLRDIRFCERMLPFIEHGRSVVFVGSAHLLSLRGLLAEQGFSVRKVFPGFWHKFKVSLIEKLGKDNDFA